MNYLLFILSSIAATAIVSLFGLLLAFPIVALLKDRPQTLKIALYTVLFLVLGVGLGAVQAHLIDNYQSRGTNPIVVLIISFFWFAAMFNASSKGKSSEVTGPLKIIMGESYFVAFAALLTFFFNLFGQEFIPLSKSIADFIS